MKKFMAIILCFSILIPFSASANAESVAGLQEKMDALFMKNNFTKEEIAEMNQQYVDFQTNGFWNNQLPFMQMSGRWHTKSHDPEEELEWYLNYVRADFDSAILTTVLNTTKYSRQYAASGHFDYLFSNKKYWAVPFVDEPRATVKFSEEGRHIPNPTDINGTTYQFNMGKEGWDFLKDTNRIEQLLLENGETFVSDIKVFTGMYTFIYIRCDSKEYLINLDCVVSAIPNIELFKLYEAKTVLEAYNSVNAAATKPLYTAEAEALQAEGLLQGNENGLDLLKPLTRIEAATMLLRAIGESETVPDTSPQVFSDVPPSHWGFGAAEKAQSLGIVNGMGDGTFAPDDIVTDTQFSAMVLRAADTGEFDWEQSVNMLIERGIITAEDAETMDLFTRGDMAKIIYEAREKGLL